MPRITERQTTILSRLIDAHIESAQPVGSKLLTEGYGIGHSSATVRHEMGALEEMGYLTHSHRSSGRLPTDSGYRYYVDHCLEEDAPDPTFYRLLDQSLPRNPGQKVESYAEETSKVLSDLTKEVGLMMIRNPTEEMKEPSASWKLLVHGTTTIIDKPEFQDRHRLRPLFEAIEEKNELVRWILDRTEDKGITVLIGRENVPEVLWDCSIVSAPYFIDGEEAGCVAVMGPKRMCYNRALPLVQKTAEIIQVVLAWPG